MHAVEPQVRTLLKKYGAEEATEEVLAIVSGVNTKKLSMSEVREIRMLQRGGDCTQREIAEKYGINPATVSRIVRGLYH